MTILVDQNTRVLCQGMTGWAGTYHTYRMMQYGTNVVAGVTPSKGGKPHLDLPVFNTVREAVAETKANASCVFVPPQHAAAAMFEAIEAEMPLVVVVTERVPVLDMVRVREALKGSKTKLVGPNSQGVLAPEICQIGVMATDRSAKGRIGVASRSASLTSEIVAQLTGIGLSDCLELFFADPETEGVVLIGEIGGTEEESAAAYLKKAGLKKPVVALVAGKYAPPARRMGHAGTLTMHASGNADAKMAKLKDAGVVIASSAHLVGETMSELLAKRAA